MLYFGRRQTVNVRSVLVIFSLLRQIYAQFTGEIYFDWKGMVKGPAEESCPSHGSQEAELKGSSWDGRCTLAGPTSTTSLLTRPHFLTAHSATKSAHEYSVPVIQLPFQSPASNLVRVLGVILDLNHSTK